MGAVRAVALTGSDQAVAAIQVEYAGFIVQETGGSSTATVRIYDNASAASGTLIGAANLAAGGSATLSLNRPIWCVNGVYVDVGGSGTVGGCVLVA